MSFIRSITFRLTVWYVVVLVGLLMVFAIMAYLLLSRNLYQGLDHDLRTHAAHLRESLQVNGGTIDFSHGDENDFERQPGELAMVYGADGTLLETFGSAVDVRDVDSLVEQALAGAIFTVSGHTVAGQEVRLYFAPVAEGSDVVGAVVVGRSPAGVEDVLRTFLAVLGVTGLVTVTLAAIGGLFLASRALQPVDRMTQLAQTIGQGDLDKRIKVESDDELGRLASTLNQMLERLEAALARERRFTADASHELRTPLAVVEAESTLALRQERTKDDYRESLELISQETAYMSTMIDRLLFLARADRGKEELNFEEVRLAEILDRLTSDMEVLCQEKGLQMRVGPLQNLVVRGDRTRLRQLFQNILENAMRYTASGGSISVSVARRDNYAVTLISDTGIGIPAEHLPHIFDRFHRVDEARSRADGGQGLGLSISKHIAELHGGRIEVESREGEGSTFSVLLPLVESSEAGQS